MHANSIFEIMSIDTSNNGTYTRAQVRYINPEGPIETGQKTIDDFDTNNQNPNNDIILWIKVPENEVTGELISTDEFKQYVADCCPFDLFEKINNIKSVSENQQQEYNNLVGVKESMPPTDKTYLIIPEEL